VGCRHGRAVVDPATVTLPAHISAVFNRQACGDALNNGVQPRPKSGRLNIWTQPFYKRNATCYSTTQ